MNREIRIGLAGAADKKELHEMLRKALAFPAHYGSNLDALHDMLTEFCSGARIVITGSESIAPELNGYFEVMKNVFADAERETPGLKIVIAEDPQDVPGDESDGKNAPLTDFDGGWGRRGLNRYAKSAWRVRNTEPVSWE